MVQGPVYAAQVNGSGRSQGQMPYMAEYPGTVISPLYEDDISLLGRIGNEGSFIDPKMGGTAKPYRPIDNWDDGLFLCTE